MHLSHLTPPTPPGCGLPPAGAGGGGVVALGAYGVSRTYGLPVAAGSGAVGTAVRFSGSGPKTFHNFSESGWRETGASTISLTANGSLAAELNHTAEWEWSGVPAPGINVTASLTYNSPRIYPIIALPDGGWLAGVSTATVLRRAAKCCFVGRRGLQPLLRAGLHRLERHSTSHVPGRPVPASLHRGIPLRGRIQVAFRLCHR